jgi:hypothetical protein
MVTTLSRPISIQLPSKYDKYLSDNDKIQQIITEVMLDYIETRQDEETKQELIKSERFQTLNTRLKKLSCAL